MNVSTIKKLVFDGNEQDLYSFQVEIKCPACSKDISFLADDMIPMATIGAEPHPNSFAKQLKLRRRASGNIFENDKGLESYAIERPCGACDIKCIVIAGIGEIQHSRFNIFLEGVLSCYKERANL